MRHIIAAFVIAACAGPALAETPQKTDPIASIEAGVICAPDAVGTAPAPNTLAGETHIIDINPPFVSHSRRVPAVLGIGFGVKTLAAQPDGLGEVTVIVTHPPMGDAAVELQSFASSIGGLDPSLTFYQFDYAYELVPGTWEMAAMRGSDVLYKVSFDVLPPALVPELAAVCGYLDLLS
ncbi:DUF3859 domain-containing protein [Loktanella agnita]|uniref:DUF3859 domain-containing protein n=1 Tax=Loktanella agnita TaxID=287097 RepID=UPI003986A863